MLKTYPEDEIRRKRKVANRIMYGGVLLTAVLALIGAEKMDGFIILDATGAGTIAIMAAAWYLLRVVIPFGRCGGDVLEVKNGKVITYHDKPFVYRTTDLDDILLVPFDFKPIPVTRTLRLPIQGNILTYKLECAVVAVDLQWFYNAFLRWGTKEKEIATPEALAEACISTFFCQNRTRFINEFQCVAGPVDQCAEHVASITRGTVVQYLNAELEPYGLALYKGEPECSVKPFIIE